MPIHLYTFFSFVVKSCIGFVLSNCANEKYVYMFFKSWVGFVLSNCWNAKKFIWDSKYTIHHSIERSQTTKCIQYTLQSRVTCPIVFKVANNSSTIVFQKTK